MDYQIKIDRPWPHRDRKRGRVVLAPGVYDVPEQVSAEVAQRALAEGTATRIYATKPPPSSPPPFAESPSPQKKVRGRKGKGPAPENKAAHVPENKLPLH